MRAPVLVLACLLLATPAAATGDGWELRTRDDGIAVYTRPLPGTQIEAFRGEIELAAGLRPIVALLQDVPRYPAWYADTSAAESLESRGIEEGLVYSVTDAPWPVKDRDSVVRWRLVQAADGKIDVSLRGEPERIPERDGRVRVPRVEGAWQLVPLGPGRTRVRYELAIEPGGSLPAWLARQWTLALPRETLAGLREQLQSRPELGSDPALAAIREAGAAADVAAPPLPQD